jgi:hypothetical protein
VSRAVWSEFIASPRSTADYFKLGAAGGPWTLPQTVYKWTAIAYDIMINIQNIAPTLKFSAATGAVGAWSGNWWGGNLKVRDVCVHVCPRTRVFYMWLTMPRLCVCALLVEHCTPVEVSALSWYALRLRRWARACVQGLWYFSNLWYPSVTSFMTSGANAGGFNVMTYDLSDNPVR